MTPKGALKYDLYRYSGTLNSITNIKTIFSNPGARFMFLFRTCQHYRKTNPLGVFFRIWFKWLSNKYNVEIPHTTKIGPGLYMGHFKNIVINQNAEIGANCNIYQGTTIGKESRGKRMGCPKIGNRVYIGINSVVAGNINIGNEAMVGPLTFVNFDLKPKEVALGSPGKVVSESGSEGYIKKTLNQ